MAASLGSPGGHYWRSLVINPACTSYMGCVHSPCFVALFDTHESSNATNREIMMTGFCNTVLCAWLKGLTPFHEKQDEICAVKTVS